MSNEKGSILLIEDTAAEGAALQKELTNHGYRVNWVNNSQSAKSVIRSGSQFQGIIADLHLGAFDNSISVALEAIKIQPFSVIIGISGVQNSYLMEDAQSLCDYVTDKPIDVGDIMAKIERGHQEKIKRMMDKLSELQHEFKEEGSSMETDKNIVAFKKAKEHLLKEHAGKYVAYQNGQLAGIGTDKDQLFVDVYKQSGKTGMLITKLEQELKPHLNISLRKKRSL